MWSLGRTGKEFRSKARGLVLDAGALEDLRAIVSAEEGWDDETRRQIISAVVLRLDVRRLESVVVRRDDLKEAIAAYARAAGGEEEYVRVLEVREFPRLFYDEARQRLVVRDPPAQRGLTRLLADVSSRTDMLRQRWWRVAQRVGRQSAFRSGTLQLTTLDALIGSEGEHTVLAMLHVDEDGHLVLEDAYGRVQAVRPCHPATTAGIFTEGSVVVAQGTLVERQFALHMVGFPPPEHRNITRQILDGADAFGGQPGSGDAAARARLAAMEVAGGPLLVFSELHLDRDDGVEQIAAVLAQYNAAEPLPHVVLMGSFLGQTGAASAKLAQNSLDEAESGDVWTRLTAVLDRLARLLRSQAPRLAAQATVVLVPGPNDPTAVGEALPRGPLPEQCTRGFRERVPHGVCASNPCRMRLGSQEVVLFRENLAQKLLRNALFPLATDEHGDAVGLEQHVVRSVIDQGHLVPLPLHAAPVLWREDAALSLYPVPDVLVLADQGSPYEVRYLEDSCLVFNPGPFFFHRSYSSYSPSDRTMDSYSLASFDS